MNLPECGMPAGVCLDEWFDSSVAAKSLRGDRHGADDPHAGSHFRAIDPDRYPAGLQQPGGPGADVLQRHAGREHREGHHRSHGALDGPGGRNRPAGVAIDRRSEHRPQLLPQRHRSERRPDAGEFAGHGRDSQHAAGHVAAGGAAVRPDQHGAGLPGGARQQDPIGSDLVRHGPLRGAQFHHGDSRRRLRRWSTAAKCGRCWPIWIAKSCKPATFRRWT